MFHADVAGVIRLAVLLNGAEGAEGQGGRAAWWQAARAGMTGPGAGGWWLAGGPGRHGGWLVTWRLAGAGGWLVGLGGPPSIVIVK